MIHLPALAMKISLEPMLEDLFGYCDLPKQKIGLNEDNGPDLQRSTLLHEIIHACFHNMGVHSEHEEQVINGLSNQLLYVIQNNPDLIQYLTNRRDDSFLEGEMEGEGAEEEEGEVEEQSSPKQKKKSQKQTGIKKGR